MEEIFDDVAKENGWGITAEEIMPDHVHLFVLADARTKPEIIVKRFKQGIFARNFQYL